MSKARHVAVLMGGWSAERDVSLASGKAIVDALKRLGHRVSEIDVARDLAAQLTAAAPDIAFNALHGRWGEDGAVQGVLEVMDIAYTHSGIAASAIAMNKPLAKKIFAGAGLPLAESLLVEREVLFKRDPLPRPYVVKPPCEGSSVGVAIIEADGKFGEPISKDSVGPWQEFATLMVEAFVPGRELSVAVLGDEALGVIELKPKRGFYDYEAKYTDGITQHVMPADVPRGIYDQAMEMALIAHRALGCRGVSRADYRYDDTKGAPGRLVLLEINTQPGMTQLSLVPEIAAHQGISFDQLVEKILADAGVNK